VLRSRGAGGGGGQLRFREEPTYLIGAAAVVLISGGDHMEVAEEGGRGSTTWPGEWRVARQRVEAEEGGSGRAERASGCGRRGHLIEPSPCAGLSKWDRRLHIIIIDLGRTEGMRLTPRRQ
jgi:hypothetical protein